MAENAEDTAISTTPDRRQFLQVTTALVGVTILVPISTVSPLRAHSTIEGVLSEKAQAFADMITRTFQDGVGRHHLPMLDILAERSKKEPLFQLAAETGLRKAGVLELGENATSVTFDNLKKLAHRKSFEPKRQIEKWLKTTRQCFWNVWTHDDLMHQPFEEYTSDCEERPVNGDMQ